MKICTNSLLSIAGTALAYFLLLQASRWPTLEEVGSVELISRAPICVSEARLILCLAGFPALAV